MRCWTTGAEPLKASEENPDPDEFQPRHREMSQGQHDEGHPVMHLGAQGDRDVAAVENEGVAHLSSASLHDQAAGADAQQQPPEQDQDQSPAQLHGQHSPHFVGGQVAAVEAEG